MLGAAMLPEVLRSQPMSSFMLSEVLRHSMPGLSVLLSYLQDGLLRQVPRVLLEVHHLLRQVRHLQEVL